MNDDEIINLFLKRDENGIIELSTKYHPYCYKIAWNLLANREDAEECLNDTWFSVWSQIPPTHPPVLAHFCGRITRNLSIDCLRKKFAGKRPDVHMADVMEEMEQLNVTYGIITERHQGKPFGRDDVPLCQIPDDLFLQTGKPVCKPPGNLEQQDACPLEQ